jgi:NlpC/P60 family putative phage cell wall peptidase
VSVTPETVLAEARRWLGTPFLHQGRLLGVGVDCAGVATEIARALELPTCDVTDYGRQPDGRTLERLCDEHMDRVPLGVPVQLGDVLLMRLARDPQHLAIVAGVEDGRASAVVHAYAEIGKVVEHGLDARWRRRIVRAYRFRGVA